MPNSDAPVPLALPQPAAYEIDTAVYDRAVRLFRFAKRFLHLNFKLHGPDSPIHRGQIFVFNHFARFETLIPQYLIHECCGAYCCAVAHRELFEIDENLSRLLLGMGAIPHDHPQLFPLLACQILRGRKVIIFPEGGMVKDRRVIDRRGRYSIYSRTSLDRRKQHTGAAVLGLALDVIKQAVVEAARRGDEETLAHWQAQLGAEDREDLLNRCREPTWIVPANITFFPLRIDDNLIQQAAITLRPGLSRRHLEELLIEGNLLLKDTDMDIRLAAPIQMNTCWRHWDRWLLQKVTPQVKNLEEVFAWATSPDWKKRLLGGRMRRNAHCIRDRYMVAMYKAVTVNLCHLAATLIYHCLEQGREHIARGTFRTTLYLAVKRLQNQEGIFLHRGLRNPEGYQNLAETEPESLHQFLCTAEGAGLIEPVGENYHFLPKLCQEFDLDTVRLENPVIVYANEVSPLSHLRGTVAAALEEAKSLTARELALLRFDDELRCWQWDREFYSAPCFQTINRGETMSVSGEPFLLYRNPSAPGTVLLVHGLLASPAVMRPLGDELAQAGYTVLGIRLKGHGTSPCDLRERSWEEWLASVRRGYRILTALGETVSLVGFSTGGLLALHLAADQPDRLASVAAIATPISFRSPTMRLVPLVHQANRLIQWMADGGIKEFVVNSSEHPETNYTHVPIRALHELRRLTAATEARLRDVHCPVLLLQGDRDPVVDPASSEFIFDRLGSHRKSLTLIPSSRHDVVFHDPGGVHALIRFFLDLHTPSP